MLGSPSAYLQPNLAPEGQTFETSSTQTSHTGLCDLGQLVLTMTQRIDEDAKNLSRLITYQVMAIDTDCNKAACYQVACAIDRLLANMNDPILSQTLHGYRARSWEQTGLREGTHPHTLDISRPYQRSLQEALHYSSQPTSTENPQGSAERASHFSARMTVSPLIIPEFSPSSQAVGSDTPPLSPQFPESPDPLKGRRFPSDSLSPVRPLSEVKHVHFSPTEDVATPSSSSSNASLAPTPQRTDTARLRTLSPPPQKGASSPMSQAFTMSFADPPTKPIQPDAPADFPKARIGSPQQTSAEGPPLPPCLIKKINTPRSAHSLA